LAGGPVENDRHAVGDHLSHTLGRARRGQVGRAHVQLDGPPRDAAEIGVHVLGGGLGGLQLCRVVEHVGGAVVDVADLDRLARRRTLGAEDLGRVRRVAGVVGAVRTSGVVAGTGGREQRDGHEDDERPASTPICGLPFDRHVPSPSSLPPRLRRYL
jgi:hypothetical protein